MPSVPNRSDPDGPYRSPVARTFLALSTVTLLVATVVQATNAPAVGAASPATTQSRASAPADVGHPCKVSRLARCGKVQVWLDPDDHSQGRIGIHYELYPRQDRSKPGLGTIMAVEGGPGYSSGGSRDWYYELYEPLLDRRQLLLVDLRGTGLSNAILCEPLQSYLGNWPNMIGRCGRQLAPNSDVWGSAFAADDVVAVLDRLGIERIDLYGDSYGTFFGQTFAVHHPDRVRTLTLDAAYFVGGKNPWYPDTNRAIRHAFTVACERSPSCARRPGSAMGRITRLAEKLRRAPLHGRAQNAEGDLARITVTNDDLALILTSAATSPTLYREVDAAARAALRPRPYDLPLLRLAREVIYTGDGGPYKAYSEGLAQAVTCNDYPAPFDLRGPIKDRPAQFEANWRALRPNIFAPFTRKEWIDSESGSYYQNCLKWPIPSRWVPAVPANATYPDIPVLVLDGDLDSLTSPDGARDTARHFPNSTYVETYNMTHVSALEDWNFCASVIARRFVRTQDPGDTSCRKDYHENRLVTSFARTAAGLDWGGPLKRTARIANASAADVMARWFQMYGASGVGLRGGTFSYRGGYFTDKHPVVRWKLKGIRWVRDVSVTGTMTWNRRTGRIVAELDVAGQGAVASHVRVVWSDKDRHATAVATVSPDAGGRRSTFSFPSA